MTHQDQIRHALWEIERTLRALDVTCQSAGAVPSCNGGALGIARWLGHGLDARNDAIWLARQSPDVERVEFPPDSGQDNGLSSTAE